MIYKELETFSFAFHNNDLTKIQRESIIYRAGSEGKAFVGNVMLDKATD